MNEEGREQMPKARVADAESNREILSILAYQFQESAYDENLMDSHISSKRELELATAAFVRLEWKRRIDDFKLKNDREPTNDERIEMLDKVGELGFVKKLTDDESLRTPNGDVENTMKYHMEHGGNAESALNQILYQDDLKIRKAKVMVMAAIEEILPLDRAPRPSDLIRGRITEAIAEDMEDDSDG